MERTSAEGHNMKYGWAVLAVVWLAGFAMPANMAKVTTLAPVLMGVFGIRVDQIGLVIALFYVLGFVLAYPAAGMINKFGIKKVVTAALACGIIGSALGLFSTSLSVFMISRFLEGAGMGLMGVCGVAAIAPWFPSSKRGVPLGIWAMWVAVAFFLCPIIYAQVFAATGDWKTIWWITFIFDIVVLIAFLIVYKEPTFMYDKDENIVEIDDALRETLPTPNIKGALKLPVVWALGLIFLFEEMAFMGVQGFFTTYANANLDTTLTVAAIIVASAAALGALMCPIAGKISDKLKTRKWVLVIGIVAGIIYAFFVFSITDVVAYIPVVILAGITGGGVPAILWTTCSEVVPPESIPGSTATLAFTQNVGMCLGAIGIGTVVQNMGNWSLAARTVIMPCFIIALIIALVGLRNVK